MSTFVRIPFGIEGYLNYTLLQVSQVRRASALIPRSDQKDFVPDKWKCLRVEQPRVTVLLPESGKAVLVSWTPKKVSPDKFLYPRIGTTPLIACVSGVEDQFNLLPMCLTRHCSA